MSSGFFKIGEKRFDQDTLKEVDHEHQNIYELMCEEWDGYVENWIIKMQADEEYDQLFHLLTNGEY